MKKTSSFIKKSAEKATSHKDVTILLVGTGVLDGPLRILSNLQKQKRFSYIRQYIMSGRSFDLPPPLFYAASVFARHGREAVKKT